MYAVALCAEYVYYAGSLLQLYIFLGSYGVLGVTRHVERTSLVYLEVSLTVECSLLLAIGTVHEGVYRLLLHLQCYALAALYVYGGSLGARYAHAVKYYGGLILTVIRKVAIGGRASQVHGALCKAVVIINGDIRSVNLGSDAVKVIRIHHLCLCTVIGHGEGSRHVAIGHVEHIAQWQCGDTFTIMEQEVRPVF